MLSGDLVRARSYKGALRCQFLDATDEGVLADAHFLVELLLAGLHDATPRGELEDEVNAECQLRKDHKQLRGLCKVLLDAATFEVACPIPPVELRERVFKLAAERAPLALGANPFGHPTAEMLLTELGVELGVDVAVLRDALYADRKEEQRLVEARIREPLALVRRYNVALAQACLLKAKRVTITLQDPPAARVRQLLRQVKFRQLMHKASRDGKALVLEIDGPESVLRQSSRYGGKLAMFLPHLLLLEDWALEAELDWGKGKARTFSLSPEQGLVSHVADRGGHAPREAGWFQERFEALDTGWTLSEGSEPLNLGGRAVVMPDFTFRKGKKVGHLEIIGFWRKDYLERRVEALRAYGPGNLILAVSKRLVADKSVLEGFDGEVVPFAEVIPSKQVLAFLEGL